MHATHHGHAHRSAKSGKAMSGGGRASFVREFLRNPAATAAIAPSSRILAKRMIDGIDLGACRSIVEFGPGSGVMTRAVLESLPDGWFARDTHAGGTFIAIEYNPRMAAIVAAEFPQAIVAADSAANIERLCAQHGVKAGTLDAVISGLGWASFPPSLTTQILEATARTLRPGGHFRTFAYHVGLLKKNAWHLRAELKRLFGTVETAHGAWANLPPAFVYRCVK
jgi:phosphatidylethanolamine/phosphatidyl-N-methylethanolamine N-methyltransferase